MTDIELLSSLAQPADTKMVLLVLDGLGGLPRPEDGQTELEAAHTPNLDWLAARSALGLNQPVGPGITPGSGPGHLSLFGYDPLVYAIGRGVLEALGIGFDLQPDDIAARGNFCTVDAGGRITDRRAGRIPTERSKLLVDRLKAIRLDDVETFVEPVKEHRFVVVLRGDGLQTGLTETDPQRTGVPPLKMEALRPEAQRTADLFNAWIAWARDILQDEHPANMVTLRGPDKDPNLPKFPELYQLRAGAIAVYPMYRGVAKLVGMQVVPPPATTAEEFDVLAREWPNFDFFFVHVKPIDSRGEDGDFAAKAAVIEQVDALIPKLLDLDPDVVVVTGDHSTPWALRAHSWHPVPLLLYARTGRPDLIDRFGERACSRGSLGLLPAKHIIALMLAYAGRLQKYGA
jgi:2,3-bisphosphoglycerate-independent phosphoglycerate mutase